MYREITIETETGPTLQASLGGPDGGGRGMVVFAHGSGSSRHSRRNRHVADVLAGVGLRTLLLDLLTPSEDEVDRRTGEHRFDVELLGARVVGTIDRLRKTAAAPIGVCRVSDVWGPGL